MQKLLVDFYLSPDCFCQASANPAFLGLLHSTFVLRGNSEMSIILVAREEPCANRLRSTNIKAQQDARSKAINKEKI